MKTNVSCLREFATLKEVEQPSYLGTHADGITTNTTTFPDIPHDGTAVDTLSVALFTTYNRRNKSTLDMTNYTDTVATAIAWMEANYDYVDLIAQGNSDIVAKAGVNGTSTNTTRVGIPSIPGDVKYIFPDLAGEMIVSRTIDKLAMGSIAVTTFGGGVMVSRSSETQLKISTPDGTTILVDVETTTKTTIKNLYAGAKINTAIANFNTNGISDVASPPPITVPR